MKSHVLPSLVLMAGILVIPACSDSDTNKESTLASEDVAQVFKPLAGTDDHIGTEACGQCHQSALRDWQGSDHDLSMQQPDLTTVRGDFNAARFQQHNVESRFERRDGRYYVTTDGPDGALSEFEVRYTFGHFPLQQYLLELPGGRLQALGIAWDSRALADGGQRWFHLYPDQPLKPGHRLHWTGRDQNWNFMCSECHSTAVTKGYDTVDDLYQTGLAELNVGCEACHGPGLSHARWAIETDTKVQAADPTKGLQVKFDERQSVRWQPNVTTGFPVREPALTSQIEIDACGRCHGRATRLQDAAGFGKSLLDSHRPGLLDPDQYDADGQMRGEVFNWGPFLQSRMYRAGVTCSDCHQPHSLALRAEDNAICTQCHQATRFDVPAHHHHQSDSTGSQCVSCHMPTTTYMQVDARHDHSFRVPRPDLGVQLGTRDACTDCHTDRNPLWAADRLEVWFPNSRHRDAHFATAFDASLRGKPGAVAALLQVVTDAGQAAIVRASALRATLPSQDENLLAAAIEASQHNDPLLRLAGLEVLAESAPKVRAIHGAGALTDSVQAVRLEAVAALAGDAEALLNADTRAHFQRALKDYLAALHYNADRPDALVTLGDLSLRRGAITDAEAAYRRALKLSPGFTLAVLRWADLMRTQGHEADAESLLRDSLTQSPSAAALHHALGLSLVRQKRAAEALAPLQQAAQLEPSESRYAYVYAIALDDQRQPEAAREVLSVALQYHPHQRDLLMAAAIHAARAQDSANAINLAQRLIDDDPADTSARQLWQWIQAQSTRDQPE